MPPEELAQNQHLDFIPGDRAKHILDKATKDKIEKTHDILAHPDQFAKVFCEVANSQTNVKQVIIQEIRSALESDKDARKFLKGVIKEVEKEEIWIWGKKIGFAVWTVLILVAGALITKYIK